MLSLQKINRLFIYNITLTFLFISILFFLSGNLFPEGINKIFSNRSWKIFLVLSIICFALLVLLSKFQLRSVFEKNTNVDGMNLTYAYLLLLPMTPIFQYLIINSIELGSLGSLVFMITFSLLTVFFVLAIPYFLTRVLDNGMAVSAGASLLFCFYYMPSFANDFNWHLQGSLKLQILLFTLLFVTVYSLIKLNKTVLFTLVITYFITNSFFVVYEVFLDSDEVHYNESKVFALAGKSENLSKPDIYLLTYDSYVANETMLGYGIDNSVHEKYLQNMGFQLYPNAYSVGGMSISSMSRMLDWDGKSYPNGTSDLNGLNNGKIRNGVSGSGVVQKILKNIGYETFGIFKDEYFFTGTGSSWDNTYPKIISAEDTSLNFSKRLILSVLEGEFWLNKQFNEYEEKVFLDNKSIALTNQSEAPRFVYTHTGPGHSGNSGVCRKNETREFKRRLYKSNIEMKKDIGTILNSKPNSIIIVNGDHGPYLTKNCTTLSHPEYSEVDINRLDIQDRLGTFLAIKWPAKMNTEKNNIVTLQDVFPLIFSQFFNEPLFMTEAYRNKSKSLIHRTAGVGVNNGVIIGGLHNGEKLFLDSNPPEK